VFLQNTHDGKVQKLSNPKNEIYLYKARKVHVEMMHLAHFTELNETYNCQAVNCLRRTEHFGEILSNEGEIMLQVRCA
jgi:hypothetical protein